MEFVDSPVNFMVEDPHTFFDTQSSFRCRLTEADPSLKVLFQNGFEELAPFFESIDHICENVDAHESVKLEESVHIF